MSCGIMGCGIPNFAAFLKKLDDRIMSEDDIEITDVGDMLLKKTKAIEIGDLFVVKTPFTTAEGWKYSPNDVGIVTLVYNEGSIATSADKQETKIGIHTSKLGNIRLVPRGLRNQFRKDYGDGYIKTFDKEKYAVEKIVEEMGRVDAIIANAMVFFDQVLESGRGLSAVEAVWDMRENLRTYVLATVRAPGWHSSWASGIPVLVASHSRFCSNLCMTAVKGGEANDKEIALIEALMPRMGFTVEEAASRAEDKINGLYLIQWRWKRPRPGADDYVVQLLQYQNVEMADILAQSMAPEIEHRQKPNLKRVAVVSAPVDDKSGQPINDRLNVLLLKMLDSAANRAAKKGFMRVTTKDWVTSEENNRSFREYFDLPLVTLASLGIKCAT